MEKMKYYTCGEWKKIIIVQNEILFFFNLLKINKEK